MRGKMDISKPKCLLELFRRPEDAREEKCTELSHDMIKECEARNILILVDLGRHEQFSVFLDSHTAIAAELIAYFLNAESIQKLYEVAALTRDKVNPTLFIYALSSAIIRRPDTKQLTLPSLCQVFPDSFIRADIMRQCRQEATKKTVSKCRSVAIRKTANDLDPEYRLAYFREDLGINLHHWHWHLVYQHSGFNKCGKKTLIVKKDRRGELFYYMHQQIIARYNFERLANNLSRVKPLNDWKQPIAEGYFPKLKHGSDSGVFPGRHSGAILKDVNKKNAEFQIQDLERMRDRILEAIHRGYVIKQNGEEVRLRKHDGVDTADLGIEILGNIIEASDLSENKPLYGNLHNSGQIAIGSCHDPDNRHLEGYSVMGENSTAMRDPVFYRWHAFIDNIFQEHKKLLNLYTKKELAFEGIAITDMKVVTKDQTKDQTDQFTTFWDKSEVDISRGLSLTEDKVVTCVEFPHLNHKPFTYKIKVDNTNIESKMGTVRIFMAPKKDERGMCLSLDKQRLLMIEMDKFTVELSPGETLIARKSSESAVTIPFERTFPKVSENSPPFSEEAENSNYCNCGWPQHMLVPKGTMCGFPVDLFVMISDWEGDKVDGVGMVNGTGCKNFTSFCGLKDKQYPDARAIGFPFDRPPPQGVKYAKDFGVKFQNIMSKDVKIEGKALENFFK